MFGGVNVDINPIQRDVQVHHISWMSAGGDQLGVGLADHLTYQPIANHPAVNKKVLLVALWSVRFDASEPAANLNQIKLLFKSHSVFDKRPTTNFTDAR